VKEQPVECQLCRIGKYPYFSYSGSGACDHCGAVWTYDEGDTLTEDSLRRLWEKVPRWIPVSERLPEVLSMVLVWSQSNGLHLASLDSYRQWRDADENPGKKITHWMPLPEPPSAL
jgi:hypothetical protein